MNSGNPTQQKERHYGIIRNGENLRKRPPYYCRCILPSIARIKGIIPYRIVEDILRDRVDLRYQFHAVGGFRTKD